MAKKRYSPPRLVRGGNLKEITLFTNALGTNPEWHPDSPGKELMDD